MGDKSGGSCEIVEIIFKIFLNLVRLDFEENIPEIVNSLNSPKLCITLFVFLNQFK